MKDASCKFATIRRFLGFLLVMQLLLVSPVRAASVALATAPLANSTITTVLPNLMFVMDNSGSMSQDYTPDWIERYDLRNSPWTYDGLWNAPVTNERNCRDSADDDGVIDTALNKMNMCAVGDVPYMNSAINVQYYNPEILYKPGVHADGSTFPSQSSPTAVLLDGYNIQNRDQLGTAGTTIDLTTTYPDRVWCTTQTPSAADLIDTTVCRKNSDYLYPNATFKYGRDNNATIANRNVLGVFGAPYYYQTVVSEYCSETELRNCVSSSTATGIYTFPAKARWCKDTNLTQCQSIKTSTYKYPRYPGAGAVAPYTFARTDIVPATTSYPKGASRTDCAGTTCTYAEEITNFANWYAYYRTRMQSMKSAVSLAFQPIGSRYRVGFVNICKGDYVPIAEYDNSVIAVQPVAATGYITVGGTSKNNSFTSIKVNGVEILGATVAWGNTENDAGLAALVKDQINSFASSPEYTAVINGSNSKRIDITSTLADGANANGDVTYTTNSAALTLSMQSGTDIQGGVTATGQKNYWYDKLLGTVPSGCGTPLRQALATVGRMYAGKELSTAGSTSGSTIDPMQYSCQQNFTLLTTDGYWNGSGGTDLSGTAMGNQDSDSTLRSLGIYEGATASSGTLADIAKYYYDTDLRNSSLTNCTGSLGFDVCTDDVAVSSTDNNKKQHMTTFTLGLGIDGTLSFVSDYKTATKGDFYDLTHGLNSVEWPVPAADTEKAVDDLWHAAVSGRGTYFSAKDPAQLASGLNSALAAIGSQIGAASAAATSTLNPVAGNNFAYVASYSTVKWQGNLEARSIDVVTGQVNASATWCVENIPGGSCTAPSTVVTDNSGPSTVYYCVTPDSNAAACPSPATFDVATNKCTAQLPVACTGTMPSKVAATSDTRTIYKNDGAGALQSFVHANVNSTDFDASKASLLSQWSVLTGSQQTAAAGVNLVNFLRGQTGYEDRGSNTATNRLYRYREATLGDPLESQPFFISKPVFSYADPGYAEYKTAQASRAGTVYMGVNDGMMHAFAADTGSERWAFVPSVVIPNMWKLADKDYSTSHRNFVNGSPAISDICTANCGDAASAVWKTILVGGLNAGGRSYYALDITDPTTPVLLWEVSSATTGFSDLGFSYGQPIITKKSDGTWVVLVTSGYNNTSPGTGHGILYVLKATDGSKLAELDTGVGDTTTPSGLAKIAAWNDFGGTNNTAGYVYGGDLLGNLWRFDINAGATVLLATLEDSLGNAQPVTTTPTLGQIKNQRVVFVGTGKYLEVNDLTNTAKQTVYGIKDDYDVTHSTLTNARVSLVQQTVTASGTTRTGSNNAVDFTSGHGWYIDLPDAAATTLVSERVNIDMQLVQGTLIFASIVPSNTVCSPGGYGWLNFINYETGGYVGPLSLVSTKYNSPIVGINVLYILGKPIIEVVTATNPTPQIDPNVQIKAAGSAFMGKRVIWRELMQ